MLVKRFTKAEAPLDGVALYGCEDQVKEMAESSDANEESDTIRVPDQMRLLKTTDPPIECLEIRTVLRRET